MGETNPNPNPNPPVSSNPPETVLKKDYDELKAKLTTLEAYVKPEDHQKVVSELETLKKTQADLQNATAKAKEEALKTRRQALISKGFPEAKVNTFGEAELNMAEGLAEVVKPKADLANGGRTGLIGSPFELARQGYSK